MLIWIASALGLAGGAWGEQLFRELGLPSSGTHFGVAVGIAVVFAAVLLTGALLGVLLAWLVLRYRRS